MFKYKKIMKILEDKIKYEHEVYMASIKLETGDSDKHFQRVMALRELKDEINKQFKKKEENSYPYEGYGED